MDKRGERRMVSMVRGDRKATVTLITTPQPWWAEK